MTETIWVGSVAAIAVLTTMGRIGVTYLKYKRAREVMLNGIADMDKRIEQYKRKQPGSEAEMAQLRLNYYHYLQQRKQSKS